MAFLKEQVVKDTKTDNATLDKRRRLAVKSRDRSS